MIPPETAGRSRGSGRHCCISCSTHRAGSPADHPGGWRLHQTGRLKRKQEEDHGKTGGKIALVTGAASGIGHASALPFAREGESADSQRMIGATAERFGRLDAGKTSRLISYY